MNLPSLNALRVFEVAARHQSLIRAAEELCVTQGAVSRQIKQLEASLGLALFERRNRAIFLTADGMHLMAACQDMLNTLKKAINQLEVNRRDRPLVVSCEPTIMMRWLIPRLSDFKEQHPQIQIHLFAAGGSIDFSRDRVDLAIRRNDFRWDKSYSSQLIGQEYVGPVCVAELANKPFPSPEIALLNTFTRPDAWPNWIKQQGLAASTAENLWFEHFYIMLEAVNAGHGVGLASVYMVEQELKNSRLSAPAGFIADGSAYYLLSAEAFESDPRKTVFLEWISQEFQLSQQRHLMLNG